MREKEEIMDENLLKYGTPGLSLDLIKMKTKPLGLE